MYVEALLNTLAKTAAHKDTLNDVHYEALVNTLPVSLAKMETYLHCNTLAHLRAKELIILLAVALKLGKSKHLVNTLRCGGRGNTSQFTKRDTITRHYLAM